MSDMRPLPYYKWYWLDWRGNRTVQRMNYIERGLYRELLDECWSEGGIPNDIEMLADICGCPCDVMADAWQVLSKCFVDSGNCLANGKQLLANKRLEKERTSKDKERITKAKNGRVGGTSKSLKNKDIVASAKQVLASPSNCHIEEKRREENKKNRSSKMTDPLFEEFWDAYSKKVGKQNAVKEWHKQNPSDEVAKQIIKKARLYASNTEVKFRKDPERWIKGRHWEDEVVTANEQEHTSGFFGTENFVQGLVQ